MLNADKNRNVKKSASRNVANNNQNIVDISSNIRLAQLNRNQNGPQQQQQQLRQMQRNNYNNYSYQEPKQHQQGQKYRKQPKQKHTSKTDSKKRRQGPMPGAPNQWYTLSNRVHKDGTTIEMMYTGLAVPQSREQLDIRAIPGVTHLTVELPPGVLPHIKNGTPDMPSLMNAMDFFKYPEHHLPDPQMGPSTTIQVIPKDSGTNSIDAIEVVPLGCTRSAPLKRSALNVAFQSYSLMQLEVDESQSKPPGRVVIDAEISPTYLLSTHQQLRLQSAVMQENLPLTDALMPIVEDLYEEHEKLQQAGLRLIPAPEPLPYGTMSFHYIEAPIFGVVKSAAVPEKRTPPYIMQVARGQSTRKKRHPSRVQGSDYIDVGATIMALDPNGNYRPMLFSEWGKLKKSQQARESMNPSVLVN